MSFRRRKTTTVQQQRDEGCRVEIGANFGGMKAASSERDLKAGSKLSALLEDEAMAQDFAAYLDGELSGDAFEKLEKRIAEDAELAAEVEELRQLDVLLRGLGADIMNEPVPEQLLSVVRDLSRRD